MLISGTTGIDLTGLPINNSGNAEVEGTLTVGGNVGIGVTPSSASKLQVKTGTNRNISISDEVTINGAATIEAIDDTRGSNISLELRGTTISITRPSGTTAVFDTNGNLLLTSGTGALGYGTGARGTVTQWTSKGTAVTLNKPSGQITMNGAALASGVSVVFAVNNSLITDKDTIIVNINNGPNGDKYDLYVWYVTAGVFYLRLKNISPSLLSDALVINFAVIKGAQA